jgi:predicted DNA-binding transcriptional regulator AlpA
MKSTNEERIVDRATGRLLNKWELAEKLRIGKRTVDLWMKQKRLPFLKVNKTVRFVWRDVLEKLNEHRVN